VPKFFFQPPPWFAAALNALIGLLLPIPLLVIAVGLSSDFEDHLLTLRSFMLPGLALILLTAVAGSIVGLATCAVLSWSTPNGKLRAWRFFAMVMVIFAVAVVVTLGGSSTKAFGYFGRVLPTMIVSAACGAAMAFSLVSAAHGFGAKPLLPRRWVTAIGGALAGLGMGLALALASVSLVQLLPALWLGLVTYFCLKPLPQKQTDGL
jgi:hypothetical protein